MRPCYPAGMKGYALALAVALVLAAAPAWAADHRAVVIRNATEFRTPAGTVTLLINGEVVAERKIPALDPRRSLRIRLPDPGLAAAVAVFQADAGKGMCSSSLGYAQEIEIIFFRPRTCRIYP